MNIAVEEPHERFTIEVDRFRGSLARTGLLLRLYDFLVERSVVDRVPKEVEVAQEMFGRSSDFDAAQDASVRVYIHRLRRKLDQFYAGSDGRRLFIPLGEYRIVLSGEAAPPVPVAMPELPRAQPPKRRLFGSRLWWAVGAARQGPARPAGQQDRRRRAVRGIVRGSHDRKSQGRGKAAAGTPSAGRRHVPVRSLEPDFPRSAAGERPARLCGKTCAPRRHASRGD